MAKMLDIILYNNCICNLQDLVQEASRSGKSMVRFRDPYGFERRKIMIYQEY